MAGALNILLHLNLLRVLRHLGLLGRIGNDLNISVVVNLSLSILDEICELLDSTLAILRFLLGTRQLLSEIVDAGELLFDSLLSDGLFGLFIRNLALSPPPLDARLQHVHTISVRGYSIDLVVLEFV